MREKLMDYVRSLFRNAPQDVRVEELQEELLQNTLDRFDEEIAAGRTEPEAYRAAVGAIGDVEELLRPYRAAQDKAGMKQKKRRRCWKNWLYWAVVIVVYVVLSLWSKQMYVTWLVFPIAGALRSTGPRRGKSVMKAIVRNVAFGLICLVLSVVMGMCLYYDGVPAFFAGMRYDETGYTILEGPVSFREDVASIDLRWECGDVKIYLCSGDEILLQETSADGAEAERLRYRVEEGTLHIYPRESGYAFGSLPKKTLEIGIPRRQADLIRTLDVKLASADLTIEGLQLEELRVDSASGDLTLTSCTMNTFYFDSVSGALRAKDCTVEQVKLDITSGDSRLEGTFGEVEFNGTSADLVVEVTQLPRRLETDTVSGDVVVGVPLDVGSFSAELDTVSGSLTLVGFPGNQDGKLYQYGEGGPKFTFESVSGNVTFRK